MEDEKNLYLTSLLHLARCLASLNPAPADKVLLPSYRISVVMGCGYMSGTRCGISFVIPRRGNSNRRLRGDMIEVFKITHNIYDRTVSPDLPVNERANTRGNHYKLQNHTFHYDLRKHFFLHAL